MLCTLASVVIFFYALVSSGPLALPAGSNCNPLVYRGMGLPTDGSRDGIAEGITRSSCWMGLVAFGHSLTFVSCRWPRGADRGINTYNSCGFQTVLFRSVGTEQTLSYYTLAWGPPSPMSSVSIRAHVLNIDRTTFTVLMVLASRKAWLVSGAERARVSDCQGYRDFIK